MAKDSKKKDNAFSKAIGALRAEKEDFLEQQIEDARRKEEEDKKEYAYWLKKSQEILVEDCLEAIGTISGEDIAKGGKTVTFSSEAFLWFKENRYPSTNLIDQAYFNHLNYKQFKHVYRLLFGGGFTVSKKEYSIFGRTDTSRHKSVIINNHLEKVGWTRWVDQALEEIFNTVSEQLKEENFRLTTTDGIQFVLSGS
jgi:hypothetical protein